MECVQLALPQRVCNELGLHLNQTITLTNSKNLCTVYVHEDEAHTSKNFEASNQHREPTLPEMDDDEEGNESLEMSDDSYLVLVVNAGNGKQKILTYQLKSTTLVSNGQSCDPDTSEHDSISNSANDVDISATELQTGSYNTPVPETSEINETVSRFRSPFESGTGLQETNKSNDRKSKSDGCKREKIVYPRYCTQCSCRLSSKSSFCRHKKRCDKMVETPNIIYPRLCLVCNHSYANRFSYSCHIKRYHRLDPDNQRVNIRPKITYPRPCPICSKHFSWKSSFSKHKIACTKRNPYHIAVMANSERTCPQKICIPNNSNDVDEGAIDDEMQPGTWIPVTNDSERMLKYFVVQKT